MTRQGVSNLFMWMMAAWPTVIKPGASESFQNAKMQELLKTYHDYDDAEVMAAFQRWSENNEKFPTTHNIINEMKWARAKAALKDRETEEYWPIDIILDDMTELTYGSYKRPEFLTHPKNPEHLQPEEWERRFRRRKQQLWLKIHGEPSPQAVEWANHITRQIRDYVEGRIQENEVLY